MHEINVEEVEDAFEDVHERLGCGESILGVPGGQSVDVIDVHVERVRRPEPVQIAAEEAAWAHEDVADVPSDDETAQEEPCRDERARTVRRGSDSRLGGSHLDCDRMPRGR